jgi:hypothetical protein
MVNELDQRRPGLDVDAMLPRLQALTGAVAHTASNSQKPSLAIVRRHACRCWQHPPQPSLPSPSTMPALVSRRLALSLTLGACLALAACGGGGGSAGTPGGGGFADPNGWGNVTALKTVDTVAGTGAAAAAGKKATVNYTLWLYDVRVADTKGTNLESGSFQFTLGTNPLGVIAGFDQGVTGMKVGGKRTITVPASLGYGATGNAPKVPANAALVFDVELTAVN